MGSILFDGVRLDHILIWSIAFLVEVIHSLLLKDVSRKLVILNNLQIFIPEGGLIFWTFKTQQHTVAGF